MTVIPAPLLQRHACKIVSVDLHLCQTPSKDWLTVASLPRTGARPQQDTLGGQLQRATPRLSRRRGGIAQASASGRPAISMS